MNPWYAELRLVFRSWLAASALILLVASATLAIGAGLHAVGVQEGVISRLASAQQAERAIVAGAYKTPGDAGLAAYDTWHGTWDAPSRLAFAALGQRDIQPYVLRIRLLGLQAQLYESEGLNPQLALPGRFDFAFVLIYLTPLIVIALMHDLVSGEREAGRLRLLLSMPTGGMWIWGRRVGLRYGLVIAALLLPLVVAVVGTGAASTAAMGVIIVSALYVAFWFGVCMLVSTQFRTSESSAAILLGSWVLLTLLLPTLAHSAMTRMVPVAKGIELTLAQRQAVHEGWDLPKTTTMEKFAQTHPEWRDTPPVTGRFHWKWYYAMQQVGDEAVAPQVDEYRRSLEAREVWTERVGWLLPAVATQVLLHRLADTDLKAHLAYQDHIAAYHATLRHHQYPYFFMERPFTQADFAELPIFQARTTTGSLSTGLLAALAGLAMAAMFAAFCTVRDLENMAAMG